jgi:hypothetical protein
MDGGMMKMIKNWTSWPIAWRISLKLIGRRAAIVTAAILGLFLLLNLLPEAFGQAGMLRPARLVETIVPLVIGLQAAFLFSPEDEPGLELLATATRPLGWIPLERLLILLLELGSVAIVAGVCGSLLIPDSPEITLWQLTGRWLIPSIALAGLALNGTFIGRQGVLGALWAIVFWWVMLYPADSLIAERPYLWPLHLYLQPSHPHFVANRLFWAAAGLGLHGLALRQLLNVERLIGSRPSLRSRDLQIAPDLRIAPSPATRIGVPIGGNGRIASSLAQLLAVAAYEHRLLWRRRTLLIVLLVPLLISLLLAANLARRGGGDLPDALRKANTIALVLSVWLPLYVGLQALPPLVADTIVKDRQLGATSFLDALPLRPAVYLLGKLLGVWFTVALLVTGILGAIGLLWRLLIGPYEYGRYLQLALAGVLPLALLQSGLILMLCVGLATRRQAAIAGTLMTVSCIFSMFLISPFPWINVLNPARPALLLYFLQYGLPVLSDFSSPANVWWTLGGGAAQLILVGLLAWLWLRRQEAYA